MKLKTLTAIAIWMLFVTSAAALPRTINQPALAPANAKTLLERLGYPPDTKLLIVHADDLGMAHTINLASIKGLESGLVTSASIMIPCPWLPEIAAYARSHPEADLGLHLTLTSEWSLYRWAPVLPKERVRLGSGEFVGEMALLSRRRRLADVISLGYGRALELSAADFRRFLASYPRAKAEIERTAKARTQVAERLDA